MADTTTAPTEKRCYYDVMNLPRDCTPDQIRTAYKKLALQLHPDKLIQSGTSPSAATAAFQELLRAYEVLSDPKERSWYDSHRSQILFSSSSSSNSGSDFDSPFPNLFSYFSPSCYTDYTDPNTGFYKVYGDVFESIYRHEVKYCRTMGLSLGLVKEAPLLGDLGSDYAQVTAFYGYWFGFCTVMDFGWVDKWDAANGVNRKSRRAMEEDNKKLRKKAKKEFNETVRGLAEFVKKRDKRVIDMMVKKEKERERKREEEEKKRKEREREKLEKARLYEEPDWAKVDDDDLGVEEEEDDEEEEEERKEFYCVACGKKFKSDKQWKNHEKSKKHKDKVAQLRKEFVAEDDDYEEDVDVDVDDEADEHVGDKNDLEGNGFVSAAEDDVDDLEEKFKECVGLEEANNLSDDEEGIRNSKQQNGIEQSSGGSDDELVDLESMISGRRNKKRVTSKAVEKTNGLSDDDVESMVYNNKKGKKKSRRAKKDKGNVGPAGDGGVNDPVDENNRVNASELANNGNVDELDDDTEASTSTSTRVGKQSFGSKGNSKQDVESKSRNSSKGRKQKEKAKNQDPVCEKCGEEFESRTKLHKHLNESGHATLKSR